MRIILCEDNANHREMLLSAFKAWAEANHCPDCEFTAYESAEELLAKEEKRSAADGFFLDLYLPGKNGFELAQMIRSKDPGVPIVFISSSGEYLRQGYEVSAYRYLIKPFSAADMNMWSSRQAFAWL